MTSRRYRRVGLALGSGAARGFAQIGVLKVLEDEGIAVDCIAGTSVGSFIGALYAAGITPRQLAEVARNVDWKRLARLMRPSLSAAGIVDGRQTARFIRELLPVHTFDELRIPLAAVATDIETGERLVFRRGDLCTAIQASIAFPGIFPPVDLGGRFVVDGGLSTPVPVDVASSMGADIVIGVCTIPHVRKGHTETSQPPQEMANTRPKGFRGAFNSGNIERILRRFTSLDPFGFEQGDEPIVSRKPPNLFKVCAQSVSIMENEINALRLEKNRVDIMIRPDLHGVTLLDFHRAEEIVRAGEEATRKMVKEIRSLAVDSP